MDDTLTCETQKKFGLYYGLTFIMPISDTNTSWSFDQGCIPDILFSNRSELISVTRATGQGQSLARFSHHLLPVCDRRTSFHSFPGYRLTIAPDRCESVSSCESGLITRNRSRHGADSLNWCAKDTSVSLVSTLPSLADRVSRKKVRGRRVHQGDGTQGVALLPDQTRWDINLVTSV